MADAIDIYGTAFKNGSVTLLARIVGAQGGYVLPTDINSAQYTVYLLDDQNADNRTPVADHSGVSISLAEVLFTTLQTDPMWTVDTTGYNFRHVLDISVHPAFTIADRRYLIEYQLTSATGQVILIRFRINVI